jgi:hypothetical protein
MMGTERFPETLCLLSELTWLTAREDFIATCRRESFKSHVTYSFVVVVIIIIIIIGVVLLSLLYFNVSSAFSLVFWSYMSLCQLVL